MTMSSPTAVRNRLLPGVPVALLAAVWAVSPLLAGRSTVDMLVFAALYAIAGLGVAFLLGQCGIVSLAQNVFFGIGAYSTAYGATVLGWPAPASMLMGIAISGSIAAAVGIPVLRLSGYFLALATLALAVIGHVLFLEWEWLTGGTLGIGGIPPLSPFGYRVNTPVPFYYLVCPIVLVLILIHYNLLHSRTGIAMRAMRDAPSAAAVLGVNIARLKVKVFVSSAVLGSFAGSLFAHYVSFVSVDSFGVDRAINFLLIAVLGGARTIPGTVLGALFVTALPNLLSRIGDVHALLFALLLILAVIFLPEGFGGAVAHAWRRFRQRSHPAGGVTRGSPP
jgi:branched-chain amino acid transport system permease protein